MDTVTNNDTKQWVDEQNKFWEEEEKRKDRDKQKESIPRKFEPETPVKVLQRGKQSITTVPSQAHKRPKNDRYAQSQNYFWNKSYVNPEYWNEHRPGYSYGPGHGHENKSWGQGNGYGKKYGAEDKKRQERFIVHQVPKAMPIIPTIEVGNLLSLHHQGGLVVAKKVMTEMGVIRVMVTGESIGVPTMILKMKMKRRVIQKIHLNLKSLHSS